MKFETEFRQAHPETMGETDREFDINNYAEWLEQRIVDNKCGEKLSTGRDYLMAVEPDEITVEDALEAFGFGRNGLE